MSALSDEYSKNFSSERKIEFNRRFREDYDPAMSELSNILRILAEMRQGSAEGGRIKFKEGLGSFETNNPNEALKEVINRFIKKQSGIATVPISDNIFLNLGPDLNQAELGGIIELFGGDLIFGGGFKEDDKRVGFKFKKEFNDGGRVAYQDGTPDRQLYETPVTDALKSVGEKTQDLITKGADQFNKFSGIDQITGKNFPGAFDEPSGLPSDFRHRAASNLLAETLGKGKFTDSILGPISYLSGAVGATSLGAIKEIGDLFVGLNDPSLTKKEAFTEFLKDNLSNIKGAFSLPGTTSEELYSEIMKDYVPMDRFGMMRLGSNFFKRQKELKNKQALERLEKARAAKTAEAAARAQTKAMAERNRARGRGGFQSDFAQDRDFMGGKGTAAEMGSFAKGGLARMLGE